MNTQHGTSPSTNRRFQASFNTTTNKQRESKIASHRVAHLWHLAVPHLHRQVACINQIQSRYLESLGLVEVHRKVGKSEQLYSLLESNND